MVMIILDIFNVSFIFIIYFIISVHFCFFFTFYLIKEPNISLDTINSNLKFFQLKIKTDITKVQLLVYQP